MPNYDYQCSTCQTIIDDVFLKIADRHHPTTQPCPHCGETTLELMAAAPHVGDAVRQGRTNLPSSWTDKLKEMQSKHYRNTIKVPSPARREV